MGSILEGGCIVTDWEQGSCVENGSLRAYPQIGRATGAKAISLRVLVFASGQSTVFQEVACDEVLYVLEGEGNILLDGLPHPVAPETAVHVGPGSSFVLVNPGSARLVLVSSRCPEPDDRVGQAGIALAPGQACKSSPAVVRLSDSKSQVTADRWYRVLFDDRVGSAQVTQFVGGIPPGRAPDHFHLYEEVLFILAGRGKIWAGESSASIAPGSCIYLPRKQVHCVENCGSGELRLLGVFYPAGSPAVRYDSPPGSSSSASAAS